MASQIFQIFPMVLRYEDGNLLIDVDCLDLLDTYLKNFDKVIFASTVSEDSQNFALKNCRPVKDLPYGKSLVVLPLPESFRISEFIKNYRSISSLLKRHIQESDYLIFCPHALIGDWSSLACLEAIKQKKPYVVYADVVQHEVVKLGVKNKPLLKRVINQSFIFPLMKRSHKYLFGQARLAIIQGMDSYEAYAPYCREAYMTYHVTVASHERISESQLTLKTDEIALRNNPLKVCYLGRADDMKGAVDWVYALDLAIKSNVPIQATWIGDGPLLSEMKKLSQKLHISEHINFLGYMSNREEILSRLRESHIFLFCHKTPESPRCLIEALTQGCPIVGYKSSYPVGLVEPYGGGHFVELGDWKQLSEALKYFNSNRSELVNLTKQAAQSGTLFDKKNAYQRTADLVRKSI